MVSHPNYEISQNTSKFHMETFSLTQTQTFKSK
jgi:hypothetical protein